MPELGVVVAFPEGEPHLAECLDSLARQSAADLGVVMVPYTMAAARPDAEAADEGPAEALVDDARRGLAVAEAMAARDRRFTLLDKGAPDLGAARELGRGRVDGEYIAFADGGDALPGYAYTYLLEGLRSGRCDFATGNVYRFNELGTRPSGPHRDAFPDEMRGTTIAAHEDLARDRLVTNKVWRREFFEDAGLRVAAEHPELAVAMTGHFLARSVDVLPAPVYYWRDAPVPPPAPDVPSLDRHVSAIRELSELLAETRPGLRGLWDLTVLRRDLRVYLQALDEASEEYSEHFFERVAAYLDSADPQALAALPAIDRLKWHLARGGRRTELVEVLTFSKSVEMRNARAVRYGRHFYGAYPFLDDPAAGVPREVYRLDDELRLRQKTENVFWRDGKLIIAGRAGIKYLRSSRRWYQQMFAVLVNAETGRRVPIPVKTLRAAEYRLPNVPEAARHDWGGFEIVVDPAKLRIGKWGRAEWRVELFVLNRGVLRRQIIGRPVTGPAQRPGYQEVGDGVWVRPMWSPANDLVLHVEPLAAHVDGHRLAGDVLELTGRTAVTGPAELRLRREEAGVTRRYPVTFGDDGAFTVRIPEEELRDEEPPGDGGLARAARWQAVLEPAEGSPVRVVLPDALPEQRYLVGDEEVVVKRTYAGHLELQAGVARPVIDTSGWEGAELRLAGGYETGGEADTTVTGMVLRARGRNEEHVVPVAHDGSRFEVRFAPTAIPTPGGELPLGAGTYTFLARVDRGGVINDVPAELDHDFVERLPQEITAGTRTLTFADLGHDTPVLKVGTDLASAERGRFAQRTLREETYPSLRHAPVKDEIFFDSYTGRQYSDSPRVIYEELVRRGQEVPASWLVRDGQVNLPEGLAPVRHQGTEWYEKLARARHIVTNSRQTTWFEKRPGQTVVQTWHGSMLKRIGFDIERVRGKARDYHEKLAFEVKQWDYLISPSPWATPILRQAFRFEGEILETGYPRNDIFFSPEKDALAATVRARLGLPADKKVLLYAPTWRDDKYYSPGRYKLDLQLDLQRMYETLGDEYVLMVRRHPRIVDRVPQVADFVHDVSLYPEIMELFLVTDVLITDYSSMMFDFANTGRPMLFFTYDLEAYRDNLRGFYFDFESTAPGPLLLTSGQLIEAVEGIGDVQAAHAGEYRAFVDQFCPLDDGGAAGRVVDGVFGRGPLTS
ncbi:MAG: glycosyltransferase [Streptosporangiales bacterium]|nr:glycosyltransferase [Streptosporangiales bacterium]